MVCGLDVAWRQKTNNDDNDDNNYYNYYYYWPHLVRRCRRRLPGGRRWAGVCVLDVARSETPGDRQRRQQRRKQRPHSPTRSSSPTSNYNSVQNAQNKSVCSASYVSWQRDTARSCCWAPAVQQSIDISCPVGLTAANPPHAATAVDRWPRQTDRQMDGHRTVTCGSVSNTIITQKRHNIKFILTSYKFLALISFQFSLFPCRCPDYVKTPFLRQQTATVECLH